MEPTEIQDQAIPLIGGGTTVSSGTNSSNEAENPTIIIDNGTGNTNIASGVISSSLNTVTKRIIGAFGLGSSYITLDGVNKRIIINDGTNDRILIGYDPGGF